MVLIIDCELRTCCARVKEKVFLFSKLELVSMLTNALKRLNNQILLCAKEYNQNRTIDLLDIQH